MAELMRYAQLVEGGKTIKQGEIFELAFQLFNAQNVIVVPTVGQVIEIKIANNSGTIYETTASVVDNKIKFKVSENIGYGQMRLEIKVTEGTTLIQKYPADGWIILNITKSLDDANVGGINAVTATQMRSEITAIEERVDTALASFELDGVLKGDTGETGPQGERGLQGVKGDIGLQGVKGDTGESGSPKGVYATLTALQTAFPTGTTGVYLVTADGHIYSWSGSAWVSRGLYQAVGISDGSVAYKMLDANLQNATTKVLEYVSNTFVRSSDGAIVSNSNYRSTGLKKVFKGDKIRFEDVYASTGANYLSEFTKDGVFVKQLKVGDVTRQSFTYDVLLDAYIVASSSVELGNVPIIRLYQNTNNLLKYMLDEQNGFKKDLLSTKKYILPTNSGYVGSGVSNGTNGVIAENASYIHSDLFVVNGKGTKIKTGIMGGSSNINIMSRYDQYGNFIEAISGGLVSKSIEHTLVNSEEYFRLSTATSVSPTLEVTIDFNSHFRVVPNGYLSTVKVMVDEHETEITSLQGQVEGLVAGGSDPSAKLFGAKFNIIGDSYVAGHTLTTEQTWSYKLGQKYGMVVRNYGINGNLLSAGTNPVVTRYTLMDNDADIICVQAGRNDYNASIPIGTMTDSTNATFKGALNNLCAGLIDKYPGKTIFFMTPYNAADDVLPYVDAILEVCGRWAIPTFDSYRNSGIHMRSQAFRTIYTIGGNDASHLNDLGMTYAMAKYETVMMNL